LQDFKHARAACACGHIAQKMIYGLLNITAAEALNGTTALNTIALTKGANILRVHDVKEAVEAVKIWEACNNNPPV